MIVKPLSKERIAEIEKLKNSISLVGVGVGENVQVVISLRDLLNQHREIVVPLLKLIHNDPFEDSSEWSIELETVLKDMGEIE